MPSRGTSGLVDVVAEIYRLFVPQFQLIADFSHKKDYTKYEGHSFAYPSTELEQGAVTLSRPVSLSHFLRDLAYEMV